MRKLRRLMAATFQCLRLTIALLFLSSFAFSQTPAANLREENKRQKRIDVRINHLIDLDYMVHKYAASKSEAPNKVEGFEDLVNVVRQSQTEFGAGLAAIHSVLITCKTASEAMDKFSQLPEFITTRKGTQVNIREGAIRYARALNTFEPAFLKDIWPQHKLVVERAADYITKNFDPKEQECFDYLIKRLGMEDSVYQAPIYLVAEGPWPGGFTFWDRTRKGACVISVEVNQGSALFETILHEAIHALDIETKGDGNALAEIERGLLKSGLSESDLAVRHGPHLLVFIQSAETVKRLIDPSHRAYGEGENGVYARLQALSDIELPVWIAYLDGKITREDAVNRIVEGLVKVSKETKLPKSR
jgi:hypothetical protein